MKQISFPIKTGRINIFRLGYTDPGMRDANAFILIAGEEEKDELLQVPDWVSDQWDIHEPVDYEAQNFADLFDIMEADEVGEHDLRESMETLLDDTDNQPVCYEINEEGFQAILVLPERQFSGRFQEHWDRVDEEDAFEDLSIIARHD